MKHTRLAILCTITLLLLTLLVQNVNCQNYSEYSIHINNDGSANWRITKFSDIDAQVETWASFQQKVFDLVDSAANLTQRFLSVDQNSFQIDTVISGESKTIEYSFTWLNFSIIQGYEILFGDVFGVNNFFSNFFGDASLQLTYPSTFSIKIVTPPPYEQNDSTKTLRWSRTQDLVNQETTIILSNNSNESQQYGIIAAISAASVSLFLIGIYMFKRRNKKKQSILTIKSEDTFHVESEIDKILKILKSSGGSMFQSEITEQTRFSKAKTSQLLATLEKNGEITRYKKGRNKIVHLKERGTSELL
jgi:uncharacterized membrane protein